MPRHAARTVRRDRVNKRTASASPIGPAAPRAEAVLAELRAMGSERDRAGMARYGINVENAFGVSVYELRKVAKRLGTDHDAGARAVGDGQPRGAAPGLLRRRPGRGHRGADRGVGRRLRLLGHLRPGDDEPLRPDGARLGQGGRVGSARRGVGEARRLRPDGGPRRPRQGGRRPGLPEAAAAHRARRARTSATSSRRRSTGRCATSASATGRSTPPPSRAREDPRRREQARRRRARRRRGRPQRPLGRDRRAARARLDKVRHA